MEQSDIAEQTEPTSRLVVAKGVSRLVDNPDSFSPSHVKIGCLAGGMQKTPSEVGSLRRDLLEERLLCRSRFALRRHHARGVVVPHAVDVLAHGGRHECVFRRRSDQADRVRRLRREPLVEALRR